MALPPPPLGPDDELSAAWLNQLVAFVASSKVLADASSGLSSSTGPNGTALSIQRTPALWAKLTYVGNSGNYSWAEAIPAPGGWATDGRVGYAPGDPAKPAKTPADPAFEAGGNSSLAVGLIVDATRDAAVGRLTFRARPCS